MTRQELKEWLLREFKNKIISCHQTIKNKYKNELQIIINHTDYLLNVNLNERLYHIINDLYDIPKCKICNQNVRFVNYTKGYSIYCNSKCSYKDYDVIEKRKRTNNKKYGGNAPLCNDKIKTKKDNTVMDKYGVKNVSQLNSIKEKKKETTLKNYNVQYSFQSEIIKNKIKSTLIEKYNVDNPLKSKVIQNKVKNTNLNKYGCEYTLQCKYIREKIEKTKNKLYGNNRELITKKMLNTHKIKYGKHNAQLQSTKDKVKKYFILKYGVDNPLKSKEIQEKIKNTNIQKYGVDNPSKVEKFKNKRKQTFIKKYGFDHIMKSKIIRDKVLFNNKNKFKNDMNLILEKLNLKLIDKEYIHAHYKHNWLCLKCNKEFIQIWNSIQQGYLCPICYPRNQGFSKSEKELVEFIKSIIDSEIIENSREIINPKELDIYIPDKKLAIEFNGLYWHSEEFKDFKYHLGKMIDCEKNNIQLIQIFEDEWLFKQDIVKSRLKQILNINDSQRIHARKCEIREIDSKTKNEFLDKFHIQGKDNSIIKLGAFHQNELISVMTFSHGNISKGSKKKEQIYELNRFCSNSDYHIPGIASKLLNYFKNNYEWLEIFSYADRRWSQGILYYKLGFNFTSYTQPNYWYIKDYKRIHRFLLRKSLNDPKDIPERVLREQEGYYRIWDCGNLKFTIINNKKVKND